MRPRPHIRRVSALLALILSLSLATTASAGQSAVVTDCNAHGALTHQYTVAQLRTALNTMPPTVKEYTNCYDVVNRALLAQIGTPGGGGSAGKSSGGSFLPVWLIVVLVLLVLGGGGYALLASRRQAASASDGGPAGRS